MPNAPTLLNDDGSASMATMFMTSHHGFRRDIALFAIALRTPVDADRAGALNDEWQKFHATLHAHHTVEDNGVFPGLKAQGGSMAAVIDQLDADHKRIDPLLAKGDRVFAELPGSAPEAAALVTELAALLDAHLALEEAHVVPTIRDARQFPPPATDAEAEMYAQGFSWSLHGIAPPVVEVICAMLPEILRAKLPAAREAYKARCEHVWGSSKTGASTTAVPDWLA